MGERKSTNNRITDASKITWQPNLLLHLSTALGANDTDFCLKLFRKVIHKLSFESFLFSTIGPTYPLNYMYSTVYPPTQSHEPPSYSLPNLQLEKHELKWTLRIGIHTSVMLRGLSWLDEALWGCQIQVVSHELPTTTQSGKLCFKSIFFWQSSKKFGKSTGYQYLKKLSVRNVSLFPFPCFCFL